MTSLTMPSPALNEPGEVPEPRRNSELNMLLLAYGVVAFAFINVAFSLKGQHPASVIEYIIAFGLVTSIAHIAMRRWAPYADPLLLPLATMINGLGVVFIYRLSQVGKYGNPGNPAPGRACQSRCPRRRRCCRSCTRCSASRASSPS
jgi:hypothetical protein